MSTPGHGDPPPSPADLLFYAPIGLLFDAQTLTPELAARGRQNVAVARVIGRMAVQAGWSRLDEIVQSVVADVDLEQDNAGTASEQTTAPPGSNGLQAADQPPARERSTPSPVEPPTVAEAADAEAAGSDVEDLPIPGYDTLAASQVVKRLGGLSGTELEAVRTYETANRARRSVLAKIARLQTP